MAKSEKRLQALKMRRNGESIRTIAHKLEISRASASIWCRDVALTDKQRKKLIKAQIQAGNKGRMIGAEMNRQRKLHNIQEQYDYAKKLLGEISDRDRLMLGIALYWGEGTKSPSSSSAAITNSDPETILFARNWFEQMGVTRDMFCPYIFISESHKARERKLIEFWSRYLDIPKKQFAAVCFLKGRPRKIYENHHSYYGVLALRIRKSKTLRYRILSLIQLCKADAGVAQSVRA